MRNLTCVGIAPVLLASALVTFANAQGPAASTEQKQTFQFQRSQSDGKSIELRVENGAVRLVRIDGETVPADRARKVPGGFDIVDGSGKVLEHVAFAHGTELGSGGAGTQRRAASVEMAEELDALARVPGEPTDASVSTGDGELPRSMIGAGLGVPDAALAHHLGIDPAKTTLVTSAIDGLPASEAGIQRFDVIISVNGRGDASWEKLRAALRDAEPGSKVKLGIRRGAETKIIDVVPVAFDPAKLEQVEADDEMLAPGMNVGGFPFAGDTDGEVGETAEANVMFFVGPDGKRHEVRMPSASTMGTLQGRTLERRMDEFKGSIEALNRRMDELMRELERERVGRREGDRKNDA